MASIKETVAVFASSLLLAGCAPKPESPRQFTQSPILPTTTPIEIDHTATIYTYPTVSPVPSPIPFEVLEQAARLDHDRELAVKIREHFAMDLKTQVLLPSGMDVYVYSEPETNLQVDANALEAALSGRLNYLSVIKDSPYINDFLDAESRFEQRNYHGFSLHVVISTDPHSCLIIIDAPTTLARAQVLRYSTENPPVRCYPGESLEYPYAWTTPNTGQNFTENRIGVIILAPFANAKDQSVFTEDISGLHVNLPWIDTLGFTIGHEFDHVIEAMFHPDHMLRDDSVDYPEIVNLDLAFYPDFILHMDSFRPFQFTR